LSFSTPTILVSSRYSPSAWFLDQLDEYPEGILGVEDKRRSCTARAFLGLSIQGRHTSDLELRESLLNALDPVGDVVEALAALGEELAPGESGRVGFSSSTRDCPATSMTTLTP